MKRIIVLAALLAAAAGCATNTPTNTSTPGANAGGNTNTAPPPRTETMAPADADVTAKEKEIWDKIKTKDPQGFGAMLADDFIYIAPEGVYDKARTVESIKSLELTDVTFSDWKVVKLDADAAVVVYTVNMKGTAQGQPLPASALRASSAWVNRGGKWVGIFHQETVVEAQPPGAATQGNKPADKGAAPSASPKAAAPPSEDHVAREKQVWESIRDKDYDRFASFLAEDQIEVFPWGVNDKAGSVNGVKGVDLSKAVLSDFKTVKIDDDAAIVTYMSKGPTPPFAKEGERSSTIWVKRGGKWLAAFHQGTNIQPPAPKK